MDLLIKILAYYGWYQSYLDPLGKPCQCITCDKGIKARYGLTLLDNLVAKKELPDDFPQITIRAVLAFYATGVGYTTESPAYGEQGKLAQYAFKTLYLDIKQYQTEALWAELRSLGIL